VAGFFFFKVPHKQNKAKTKHTQPTVFISVQECSGVAKGVEKNSMVKKKRKKAKKSVKKQKIGAAHVRNTTLLPTGPHYHRTTLSQTRVA
jgi:hypothetical protein